MLCFIRFPGLKKTFFIAFRSWNAYLIFFLVTHHGEKLENFIFLNRRRLADT